MLSLSKQQVLISIIEDIVMNVEELSKEPQHIRYVHYVKNEIYPAGVYRIHANSFMSKYLKVDDEYTDFVNDYCDTVEFDRFGWLTIRNIAE